MPARLLLACAAAAALPALGCVPDSYRYGSGRAAAVPPVPLDVVIGEPPPEPDEKRGPRLPVGVRRVSPELSLKTADQLLDYLEKNDLGGLRVEVRHHDTAGQWRRLRANTGMSPMWRYTAGTLSVVGYSLGLGGDKYNPFTDTLSVDSDDAMALLHAAAAAKVVRSRRWPGPYAVATSLPGIGAIRAADAADDVVGYARAEKDWETERRAYRELYARVGVEGAQPFGVVVAVATGGGWWVHPAVGLGGGAIGRAVGYVYEKRRQAEAEAAKE